MGTGPESLAEQRRRQQRVTGLRSIHVARGVGTGPTKLAAFDAALLKAGAANFNLIELTSVIPPCTNVEPIEAGPACVEGEWGDRLYVVMAHEYCDVPGQQAWAGVGWVQEEGTGKGLFVEHHGLCEQQVRRDLKASLASIAASRPHAFGPPDYVLQDATCSSQPTCALVLALYGTAPWPEPMLDLR